MNGFLGALIEAWAEFRVNRARVVLSLVGVGIAVLALTAVVGVGQIVTQAQVEQMERSSGRPATLQVATPYDSVSGQQGDTAKLATVIDSLVDRYSITYWGSVSYQGLSVQLPTGVQFASLQTVDPAYGVMHRVQMVEGAWFADSDQQRMMPAIIIGEGFWRALGSPPLGTHPIVTLLGAHTVQAIVTGVYATGAYDTSLSAYLLNAAWPMVGASSDFGGSAPQYEFWVPTDIAEPLTDRIRTEVAAAFGDGWQVSVNRQDYLAWSDSDPLAQLRLVLVGIAALILLLGALGLVNISLVTVRQRIREIGIRRAFGATSGRVFLAVMLESVVATAFAGGVGVVLAIILVRSDWVLGLIAPGLSDVPRFPAEAAIIGFVAATGVGALAGLLPALVAVRVKVIDAIRY